MWSGFRINLTRVLRRLSVIPWIDFFQCILPEPIFNVESQRIELQPVALQATVQHHLYEDSKKNCDAVDTASYIWPPFRIPATQGSCSST